MRIDILHAAHSKCKRRTATLLKTLPTNASLRLLCNSLPGLCRESDFTSGLTAAVLKVIGKRPLFKAVVYCCHVSACPGCMSLISSISMKSTVVK